MFLVKHKALYLLTRITTVIFVDFQHICPDF
jgi:hypothetical protein